MRPCVVLLLLFGLSACSKEKMSDKAGEKMQDFVVSVSDYARSFDNQFIVIPQNGPELAFNYLTQSDGQNARYMNAIDGVGMEALFYNGSCGPEMERLDFVRELSSSKTILVSEYLNVDSMADQAVSVNNSEGFICFPRVSSNYDYLQIPDTVYFENDADVLALADAKNYLYLISTDGFSSKNEMVASLMATNFDLLIIDLFFDGVPLTSSEVASLKTKENGGQRLLVSYMNIGSAEKYRYYWEESWRLHHPHWLKKPYEGYEDEIWVEYWKHPWQEIIFGNDASYTKKILDAGFDGVYLDNVEGYYFLYFE